MEVTEIYASDGLTSDLFGNTVDISGDNVVVGNSDGTGAAYVFNRNKDNGVDETGWGEVQIISGEPIDSLEDLAISGDYIVIGDDAYGTTGAAHVFFNTGAETDPWVLSQTLVGSAVDNAELGMDVNIFGDYIAASAEDGVIPNSGVVHIFFNDPSDNPDAGFEEIAVFLYPNYEGSYEGFGKSLALTTDSVFIGAPDDRDAGMVEGGAAGAAYIFPLPSETSETGSGRASTPEQQDPSCNASLTTYDLPNQITVSIDTGVPIVVLDWSNNDIDENLIAAHVFREAVKIATITNPETTTYLDAGVEPNTCNINIPGQCQAKPYKYYIQTENICNQTANGSVGTASVNPVPPDGTPIEVTADITLIIKDGFTRLFEEKLDQFIELSTAEPVLAQTSLVIDPSLQEATCNTARDLYYRTRDTRHNELLATDYILQCYGGGRLTREDISNIVDVMIQFQLTQEQVEALIQAKIDEIMASLDVEDRISTELGTISPIYIDASFEDILSDDSDDRDSILCGGVASNECGETDRDLVEDYFEGSSHAANLLIEVKDSGGNLVGEQIRARTNIFGEIIGLPLGTLMSGEDYTVSIVLEDERYVLPKNINFNISNPTPVTNDAGELILTANLNMALNDRFCFGNFNEDDAINIVDMIELRNLTTTLNEEELFEIWDALNIDGLEGLNLYDLLVLIENFQCETEIQLNSENISLFDLAEIVGL